MDKHFQGSVSVALVKIKDTYKGFENIIVKDNDNAIPTVGKFGVLEFMNIAHD